jgi:hypothetical protein
MCLLPVQFQLEGDIMPNIALNKHNQEIILGYKFYDSDPRTQELREGGPYKCPHCQNPLSFRCGSIRCGHFYHEKSDCIVDWKPESNEHIYAKYFFQKMIQENLELNARQEVMVGHKERICDVLISSAVAPTVALEIQMSKISLDEIKERTDSYRKHNIHVIWLLDEKKFSSFIDPAILNAKFFFIKISDRTDNDYEVSIRDVETNNVNDFRCLLLNIFKTTVKKCLSISKTPADLSMNLYGNFLHIDKCRILFDKDQLQSEFFADIQADIYSKNKIKIYEKEISNIKFLNEELRSKNENLKKKINQQNIEINSLIYSLDSYRNLMKEKHEGKGNFFVLRCEIITITKHDNGDRSLKTEHVLPSGEIRSIEYLFSAPHILDKINYLIEIDTCAPSNSFVTMYGYININNNYRNFIIQDIDIVKL